MTAASRNMGSLGRSAMDSDTMESRRRRRVLVLGGWSPGPLDVLRSRFRDTDFHEPNIPMPPAGCRWCINPFWAALLLYLGGALPLLMDAADSNWIAQAVIIVAS